MIDPGCYTLQEQQEISGFIDSSNLKPVKLINTHCHIDHIIGNKFIADRYDLDLEIHELDKPILDATVSYGSAVEMSIDESPAPKVFLDENDVIRFGSSALNILFTPGHSPGSISFFDEKSQFAIVGDVLFLQSIGRTDLPGGNLEDLLSSIKNKLIPLGDAVEIYPGHGPKTTIGFERENNPFLVEDWGMV